MIARLWRWYGALAGREQRMVLIGTAVALGLVILALLLPLQRAVNSAQQRVEHKRGDLLWLRATAPQLAALQRNVSPRAASNESLVVLVDRVARESNLTQALTGSQPSGDGGLRVRLEQAPFDTLIAWLAQLAQRYGVRIDSATIETTNASGIVNASLVLRGR